MVDPVFILICAQIEFSREITNDGFLIVDTKEWLNIPSY
jgi:hypothetical protein